MFSFLRTISRTGSGSNPAADQGGGTSVTTSAIVAAGIGLMGIAGLSGLAGIAGLASSTAAAQADTPEPAVLKTVGLVCDGSFQVITGGVDSAVEEVFDGPAHLALTMRDNDFVGVTVQTFERGILMPEQVFALGGGMLAGSLDTADASQSGGTMAGGTMAMVLDDSSTSTLPAGNDDLMVEITATDIDVMLTQSLESGPVIKARVEGRPLVPTREIVATTELYLDRINGEVTVNWTDNRVRDHKLPGAIRAAKVQLRDEKIFTGSCQTVAQRAF